MLNILTESISQWDFI